MRVELPRQWKWQPSWRAEVPSAVSSAQACAARDLERRWVDVTRPLHSRASRYHEGSQANFVPFGEQGLDKVACDRGSSKRILDHGLTSPMIQPPLPLLSFLSWKLGQR